MSTDPTPAILTIQDLTKSYGAQPVLDRASLTVHEGDRIGLIGRNGTGKSTLLRVVAGIDQPTDGQIVRRQGLRISMLGQREDPNLDRTVDGHLMEAASEVRALIDEHDALAQQLAADTTGRHHARLAHALDRLQHELETRIGRSILAGDVCDGSTLRVTEQDGQLKIEVESQEDGGDAKTNAVA